MSSVTSYHIQVPVAKLARLRQKLELTDLPDETEYIDTWSRGTPLGEISRLVQYWKTDYSWRKAEEKLNAFPQQLIKVEVASFGVLTVHAIHQRSSLSNAIPLLFVHGWPGSFIEATKIAPKLVQTDGGHPSFHVVAVSLVDFGFSGPSKKAGFSLEEHAEAYHKVMLTLGYSEYIVQGGDLGYLAARFIARKYPSACKAHHVNMRVPRAPTIDTFPKLAKQMESYQPDAAAEAGNARMLTYHAEGSGYMVMQSTRPQTIGYSMADSPVGLLAWIYEKLHDWSDSYPWTDEEIITWVCVYLFSTAGAHASQRVYYEMTHSQPPAFEAQGEYVNVPLGISRFPMEISYFPKPWDGTLGPIVFERDHPKGGHFAAYECPDAIVQDLRDMFGEAGGAYGCVDGHSGYSK